MSNVKSAHRKGSKEKAEKSFKCVENKIRTKTHLSVFRPMEDGQGCHNRRKAVALIVPLLKRDTCAIFRVAMSIDRGILCRIY